MTEAILIIVTAFLLVRLDWWTSGAPRPSVGSNSGSGIEDMFGGIDESITHYYGTSDPSSGASPAWGADQLGALWFDANNELGEGGDDLGGEWKLWVKLTAAPTYGWRTLCWYGYKPVEPNEEALLLVDQATTAPTDLDLNPHVSDRAIRARLLVEVEDSGTVGSAVYAAFRKDGTTTDANERRVYPQATDVPVTAIIEVELSSNPATPDNKLEYEIAASGASSFDLKVTVLGYWERS